MWFIDTSAFVKLVRDEVGSDALREWLGSNDVVGCDLLRTEARRAVIDDPAAMEVVDALLVELPMIRVTTHHFDAAGRLPGPARSLDALHLVAAMDLGEDLAGLVSYDERQIDAARQLDVDVVTPTSRAGPPRA